MKDDDIVRCASLVEEELRRTGVLLDSETLRKIAVEILDISYSHGGDYSGDYIKDFAVSYIKDWLYRRIP